MDRGAIIQVWRGEFLDATPMWYSRGDGSSRPVGAVQYFGKPSFTLAKLPSADAAWVSDSTVTDYVPKGYKIDKADIPTFRYTLGGAMIEDAIRTLPGGEGLSREITVQNPTGPHYARLAEGSAIEDAGNGLYIIDDKSYYIRIDDAAGAKPVLRDISGRKMLLIPVQQKLRYSILF
jgi:hypothetical protein